MYVSLCVHMCVCSFAHGNAHEYIYAFACVCVCVSPCRYVPFCVYIVYVHMTPKVEAKCIPYSVPPPFLMQGLSLNSGAYDCEARDLLTEQSFN